MLHLCSYLLFHLYEMLFLYKRYVFHLYETLFLYKRGYVIPQPSTIFIIRSMVCRILLVIKSIKGRLLFSVCAVSSVL